MKYLLLIVTLSFFISACDQQNNSSQSQATADKPVIEKDPTKYYSFFNEELPPKKLQSETRETYEENLEAARANLAADPDSLALVIWYGRRLAYLGNYYEAISVYTSGLQQFPNSYKLRRHRGHRYITTRQLSKAIDDFELAAFYSLNYPDQIEPDGKPNTQNQPLSTDKFNIWYHYGLAHYLSGRYDKALSAYRKCMEFSENDDLRVATQYWLYLTYQKLGNQELAAEILSEAPEKPTLIENDDYFKLLQLYKGEVSVDALLTKAFTDDGEVNPTLGYGIGVWYQHQKKMDLANETFLKILDTAKWDAFGFIAAEAELTATFPVPAS